MADRLLTNTKILSIVQSTMYQFSSENTTSHTSDIEVYVQDIQAPSWIETIPLFIQKVLWHLKFYRWNLCIVLCSNSFIRKLNKEFRSIDLSTDVLSFASGENFNDNSEELYYAGDIVISVEALAENSKFFQISENEELKRLIIHAILHLGGWDHSNLSPEQPMLRAQEEILSIFSEEKLV